MLVLGSWSTVSEEIHLLTPSRVRENIKGHLALIRVRDRSAGADSIRNASQYQILRFELCQPMTPALPVAERRLRHIAVLWAARAGYCLPLLYL